MPLKVFCPSCGFGALYEIKKPNFCPECSRPYSMAIAQTVKPVYENKTLPQRINSNIPIEEEQVQLPKIDNLLVDIIPDKIEKVVFGEFVGSGQGEQPIAKRNIPKRINKKKVLEELKMESQSSAGLTIGD